MSVRGSNLGGAKANFLEVHTDWLNSRGRMSAATMFCGHGGVDLKGRRPSLFRSTKTMSNLRFSTYQLSRRLVMDPTSKRRLFWDVCGIACLAFDLITLPLKAFELGNPQGLTTMSVVTTAYWSMDMVASFFTGYQQAVFIEMDPQKIAIHYFKGWFVMDFVLVAADCLATVLLSDSASVLRVGKGLLRGMRAVRLLRLVKLRRVIADISDRMPSEHMRTLLHIAKLMLLIISVNHYIACGWYLLGSDKDIGQTWVFTRALDEAPLAYQYTTSLHWSLTQFTPASMEVVPTNTYERTYSVCVLMFALVMFSSFVSSITSSMTHLHHINARQLHQQVVLRRFLCERGISAPLVIRVLHYIQFHLKQRGTERTKESSVDALKMLPESMRAEIHCEAYRPTLLAHPFFYQYNLVCEGAMLDICNRALVEVSLVVGQEVFADNKNVQQMVFVLKGSLKCNLPAGDVEGRKSEAPTAQLLEMDQWACEASLWASKVRLAGPLVAVTFCDLLLLNATDFRQIAQNYPSALLCVSGYADYFVEYARSSCDDKARWKIAILNDHGSLLECAQKAFDCEAGRRSSVASGISDAIHNMTGSKRNSLNGSRRNSGRASLN